MFWHGMLHIDDSIVALVHMKTDKIARLVAERPFFTVSSFNLDMRRKRPKRFFSEKIESSMRF